MSEKVEIEVSVTAIGAEVLSKVDTSMTALAKTTEKGVAITKKENEQLALANTSLAKQVPWLKDLNPLWSNLGVSWLMGASAVGAVGLGMMKVGQTAMSLQGGFVTLGASLNEQTIGPMQGYADLTTKVTELSDKWFVSSGDIQKAMIAMNPTITDQTVREDILNQALKTHRETGISLEEAVKKLSDAYSGDLTIRDKNTGAILKGNDALNQEYQNLMALQNTLGKVKSLVGDFIGKEWNDFVTGLFDGNTWVTLLKAEFQGLPGVVKTVTGFMAGHFFDLFDKVASNWSVYMDVKSWLLKLGKDAYDTITGPVFDWFKSGWNMIASWVGDHISSLGNLAGNLFNKGGTSIMDIGGGNQDAGRNWDVGTLASYANGTDYVPATGNYQLHKGEAVIPANRNGGQTINLYLSYGTPLATWVMDQIEGQARLRGAY